MNKIVALIFGIILYTGLQASHTVGGNLSYKCIGTNPTVLELNMSIYVDCPFPFNGGQFSLTNDCGLTNPTISMFQIDSTRIVPYCPSTLTACDGGTFPEYIKYSFTTNVTLTDTCDSWKIIFNYCCRPTSNNLSIPSDLHYETTVNTTDILCDNSPIIQGQEIPYFCSGQNNYYCVPAYDVDGDSLSFEIVNTQGGLGNPIPYNVPYTVNSPISNLVMNTQTGCFSFNEPASGMYNVAVRAHSWDNNGNHIGYVTQDFPIIIYSCSNSMPIGAIQTVTGVSANQTGQNSIEVCVNDPFCFDIVFIDGIDSLKFDSVLSNLANAYNSATITSSGINPLLVNICWTPSSLGMYSGTSFVNDNYCPINGIGSFTSIINIVNCLPTNLEQVDNFENLSIYPSPKSQEENLIIDFFSSSTSNLKVIITNVSGQEIVNFTEKIKQGENRLTIKDKLPHGILFIHLVDQYGETTRKIIVQ